MSIGKILLNNLAAKSIALFLAVLTWFYVYDLVRNDSYHQGKQTAEEVVSQYNFIVKEVPVRPAYVGQTPEGYKVEFDKVKIVPEEISVFGPKDIVERLDHLNTEKINLSEYTRSVRLRLGLKSRIRFLRMEDKVVDVYLPVKDQGSE
jgi:YbbR domain-containing protein